jgi:hypothetical protein
VAAARADRGRSLFTAETHLRHLGEARAGRSIRLVSG